MAEVNTHLREGLGEESRSFWQMAWVRFRRHPLARLGGWVLIFLYLGALFADFIAPYPEVKSFRKMQFAPPTPIHWRTEDGRLTRPYVCKVTRTRDLRTFKLVFKEDCSEKYPIYFFVRGYEYKFLGLIPMDLHLFGGPWVTEEKAQIFLWGSDDFGRDLFSRIWFGARVSLTVGIFATILALVLGVFFGGLSGLYAGRPLYAIRGFFHPSFRKGWRESVENGRPWLFVVTLLLQLLFWGGAIAVLAVTLSGFWQVSAGLERWVATLIGGGAILWIVWALLFGSLRVDLDDVIMRTTEILAAIPGLYLLISLAGVMRSLNLPPVFTFYLVITILSFVGWGGLARTIRSMVLQLREMEYAQAATALGASEARVLIRHILPGTFTYLIVVMTLAIPGFILGESALSFLGLGIQEPASSWGLLLSKAQAEGIAAINTRPWLLLPGFFIFVSILAYNFLGDGLRDALDPRAKR